MFDCYDNIVGFSQVPCDCSAASRPADYNESQSGLFIDSLKPIESLISQAQCDETMWDILTRSRDMAISTFVSDSNALLSKKFKLKRKPAKDQVIGEIKAKKDVSSIKNYAVVAISCCKIKGGQLTLNNLGTLFPNVSTFDVDLYDNVSGFIQSISVTTTAGKHSTTNVNLDLPMYSKYVETLEYYLVYEFDSGNMPKDNDIDCGCGNFKAKFNRDNPQYATQVNHKSALWANYVSVGGHEINSISELDDIPNSLPVSMYGLTLDLSFTCKISEVICDQSLDFVGNPLALSIAYAILYKSASLISDFIMKSGNLSRENMIAREEWEESSLLWNTKYNEHVNYIVGQTSHTANDCFTCKDIFHMTRAGLFA